MLGAGLSGFAAGYGSNTTATVQNSNGSTSTVTLHDNAGARQAEQDAANNRIAINTRSATEAVGNPEAQHGVSEGICHRPRVFGEAQPS